jgi:hypothetical protein
MPEYPNAHPGAPLTIWLRKSDSGHYYQHLLDPPAPDAIEYIRKDVCDAWLAEAERREAVTRSWNEAPYRAPPLREVMEAALSALGDKDVDCAAAVLRTALRRASE